MTSKGLDHLTAKSVALAALSHVRIAIRTELGQDRLPVVPRVISHRRRDSPIDR